MRHLFFALLVTSLAGCGTKTPGPLAPGTEVTSTNPSDPSLEAEPKGGIQGTVTSLVCGGVMPVDPPEDYAPCTTSGRPSTLEVTLPTGEVRTIQTNAQGFYQLALPAGTYTVTVSDGENCSAGGAQLCPEPKSAEVTETFLQVDFQFQYYAP